jgi:hypothetical protein
MCLCILVQGLRAWVRWEWGGEWEWKSDDDTGNDADAVVDEMTTMKNVPAPRSGGLGVLRMPVLLPPLSLRLVLSKEKTMKLKITQDSTRGKRGGG